MSDHQFQEREFESNEGLDLVDLLMGGQTEPLSGRQEIQDLLGSLPRLTEQDLIKLRHGDNDTTCPVCITPLPAILAEEEMAIAMESPAHPFEELGVTRLWIESREEGQRGCGHVFCRRCISKWITGGHDSCPTCRHLMVPRSADAEFSDVHPASPVELDEALRQFQFQMRGIRNFFSNSSSMPDEDRYSDRDGERVVRNALPAEIFGGFGGEGSRGRRGDDRSEYIGMYS